MENLPAISNSKVPAHLANRAGVSAVTTAVLTGAPASVPRISLKQGRFRIREGQDEFVVDSLFLDTVIVGAVPAVSKLFYAKPWNPGDEPTAPDCHSILGDRPAADSSSPQNDVCATCPKNAWGSKLTPAGKQIKACSDSRRIAVVAADDPEKIYLVSTPAASMKNLTKYTKALAMHGRNLEDVRTRLTFDEEAEYPLLNFDFAGYLDEATYATVQAKLGSVEVQDVLGLYQTLQAPKQLTTMGQIAPSLADPIPAPAKVEPKPEITRTQAAPQPEPEAPKRRGRPPGSFGKAKAAATEETAAPVQAPTHVAPVRGFGKPSAAPVVPITIKSAAVVANSSSMAELESQLDTLLGTQTQQ